MDETQRIDASRPPTRVITLPPKERVNIVLAVVAGALAVLVIVTAHDTFASRQPPPATPAVTSPAPTEKAAPARVAPAAPHDKRGKGEGDD